MASNDLEKRHTLAVLVENKPGVLTRVAAIFARRAYNIHSLAVGPTEDGRISRITLVVDSQDVPLEQLVMQLSKLVNVLKIEELTDSASVQRELLLVKVAANDATRTNVLQVVDLFRAHVVDVVHDTLTIETIGSRQKVAALLAALEPYGIKEMVKSGMVAISRGDSSLSQEMAALIEEK